MKLKITILIFLFSYTTFAQLPDECKLSFGTNFAGLADWGTELPFVDLMKNARTWYTKDIGNPDFPWNSEQIENISLRPDGYPTHIPQDIEESIYPQRVSTIWAITDGWPAGIYTVLWEGTGELSFWGGYQTLQQVEDHKILFDFPEPVGNILEMTILESDINDPIRNIRVLMPGTEDTYETEPFYELWLEKMAPFHTARFMDWGSTNNWGQSDPWTWDSEELFDWEDRAQMDHYTWATNKGIPYEMMIQLMNQYEVDGWVCVPHRASDDYIQKMAELFRDNLNEDRHLTVEYSNETWNWIFGQAQWLNTYGCIATGTDWPEGTVPYVQNCLDIWSDVFVDQMNRITRAVGVQTGWQDVSNRVVNNLVEGSFDALALTYYFGLTGEGDEALDALGAAATTSDVAFHARQGMEETKDYINTQKEELADVHNIPIVFYEGGQHITPHPFGEEPTYAQALLDIQRDTAMYNMYMEWFDFLRTIQEGDEPLDLMNFSFVGGRSARYGSWGILETLDQDTSLVPAPKYQAIMETIGACELTDVGEPSNDAFQWSIAPNPGRSIFQIKTNLKRYDLSVFNQLGQILIEKKNLSYTNEFGINHLPQGSYFIKITDSESGESAIRKFVKA